MTCGCISACGCNVIGDGVTTSAVRVGDTITISAIQAVAGVADTDCVQLAIDGSQILRASLVLEPAPQEGGIQLDCTPAGLAATLLIDPASTAIVSVSEDGLRVDIPPPPAAGGTGQPGDLIFHGGVGPRANCIDADGSAVSRAGYAALWDALSLYTLTATRDVGNTAIYNIPSTRFIDVGMIVEATAFPPGTTVVSVDSSTQITVSDPATNSGNDTELRVYPWGNGDGSTTFNVPDGSDRYPLGFDYTLAGDPLGTLAGDDTFVLGVGNLPLHDHPATVIDPAHDHPVAINDLGHDHSGSTGSDGVHNHEPATARDSNFVTILDPVTGADYVSIPTTAGLVGATSSSNVSIPTQPGPGGGPAFIDYQQADREFTSNDGLHSHTIPSDFTGITADASPATTGITVTVDDAGSASPAPVEITPLHMVGRWVVHT
jgi:hypothetical protein